MQTTRVLKETVIRCSHSNKLAGKPSKDTLYDWRTKGIERRCDGVVVTLEWCRLGGQPVTSLEAYERFHKRVNGELPPAEPDQEEAKDE